MSHPFGKKTHCTHGHRHDSKAEAKHCDELHQRQMRGEISDLTVHHKFDFIIGGEPVKLANGQTAGWKVDFIYNEKGNGWTACESKTGLVCPSFPLRLAIFRALYPDWSVRILKT